MATAPAISRLVAAGATLTGKTILEELCYGLTGESPFYGTPHNSASPDHVPGGSSSGSAAAVGAGLVDFALGSDTVGSIRLPASFATCGAFAHRHRPSRSTASCRSRRASMPSAGSPATRRRWRASAAPCCRRDRCRTRTARSSRRTRWHCWPRRCARRSTRPSPPSQVGSACAPSRSGWRYCPGWMASAPGGG
ncbi:MAG: hypothetical protein EXQ97_06730 [Alphaproteobacteria bacterium]|nr:hypothetical protein [Alphaproteobacteria bacterium]